MPVLPCGREALRADVRKVEDGVFAPTEGCEHPMDLWRLLRSSSGGVRG